MKRCSYCGQAHDVRICPKTWGGSAARANLRCSYCGERDHNRDACPKAWPGPDPIELD